jgi:filamentous hemagglutinin family protein
MKRRSPVRVPGPRFSWGGGVALLGLFTGVAPGLAQISFDGTLGAATALNGPDFAIPAESGALRGNNLFHSFSRFDLKSGETATFLGPAGIRNILGRVTGGEPSGVDGTIRSGIQGANLFLINPSGMIFGPNAVVDVSGSFAASSANYLRLADGARFVASLDADDSVLTSEPVAAFGFLDGAGGSVEVRGRWNTAGDLTVVGSSVTVQPGAHLDAGSGGVHLVGAAVGEVTVPASVGSPGTGGVPGEGAGGSERVVIRGGRLVVDHATVQGAVGEGGVDILVTDRVEVRRGGQILTSGTDGVRGGDIRITAETLLVDGEDGPDPTRIAAETMSSLPEDSGGDVVVRAGTVELRRGAEISVSAVGAGAAGRVEVDAGTVRLVGSEFPQFPTQISANAAPVFGVDGGAGGAVEVRAGVVEIDGGAAIMASAMGDAPAGSIRVDTGSLTVLNGAVTTFAAGAGAGGEIRIQAGDVVLDGPFSTISALTTGLNGDRPAGAGGRVEVRAGRLEVRNDAGISTTTFGDGAGGSVRVEADTVVLDTATFQPGALPGIGSASQISFFGEGGGGAGGNVEVVAGSLVLRGGMSISASTATSGDGGGIQVRAGSLDLAGGSSIQAASTGTGRAGTVGVDAGGGIRLAGQSQIGTSAPDSSGGDMVVRAGGDIRLTESQFTSQAGPGGGGNITVASPSMIYLLDSRLTAQAIGDGGNLTIEPDFLVLNGGGLVSKSSTANGGNITIRSGYFLRSASVIDASAPFGLPGEVTVTAPDVDLIGSLVDLPGNLLGLETLLRPDCGVRLGGGISSFIVLPRGGLPVEPGGFIPSAILVSPDEKR